MSSAFVRRPSPRSLIAFLEVSCSPHCPIYTLDLRTAPMRQSNEGRSTGCCLINVCIMAINIIVCSYVPAVASKIACRIDDPEPP